MSFLREKGQGLVEYALILVLIAVVVIGALSLLGPQINSAFSRVITELGGTVPHTYTITNGPTISANYNVGIDRCTYQLSMSVKVTDGGAPVSGSTISVSVSGGPASGSPPAQTTNSSGIATWTSADINFHNGTCNSGTSNVSVANGAASGSDSY